MANIFKQYKDSRTSASLFTETGSFPSSLRSSTTVGQKAVASDMHVSCVSADDGYSCELRPVSMPCFDNCVSHNS